MIKILRCESEGIERTKEDRIESKGYVGVDQLLIPRQCHTCNGRESSDLHRVPPPSVLVIDAVDPVRHFLEGISSFVDTVEIVGQLIAIERRIDIDPFIDEVVHDIVRHEREVRDECESQILLQMQRFSLRIGDDVPHDIEIQERLSSLELDPEGIRGRIEDGIDGTCRRLYGHILRVGRFVSCMGMTVSARVIAFVRDDDDMKGRALIQEEILLQEIGGVLLLEAIRKDKELTPELLLLLFRERSGPSSDEIGELLILKETVASDIVRDEESVGIESLESEVRYSPKIKHIENIWIKLHDLFGSGGKRDNS